MSYRFEIELPVRWSDIDNAGVLNNAVYLTLIEQARFGYFLELALMAQDNFPFLLGETSVRFLQPGRAGMILRVLARVSRLGNKSLDMTYEVRHGDEILATATAALVWVDETLRSAEIPDAARTRIAEFEGIPCR